MKKLNATKTAPLPAPPGAQRDPWQPIDTAPKDGRTVDFRISTLRWAEERLANSQRISAQKTGADQAGWLDDVWQWERIVDRLHRADWLEKRCVWYQQEIDRLKACTSEATDVPEWERM